MADVKDNVDKDTGMASSDEAWVRQMASITLKLNGVKEVSPQLVTMWVQSLATARRQASESIGDIQVVPEYRNERVEGTMETKWFYRPSIKGASMPHYCAESQTSAILLALGEKHLGYGNGRDFAKYGGRLLGINDSWTQAVPSDSEARKQD